jgi:Ca2+-binding EF-hand superfamily protein
MMKRLERVFLAAFTVAAMQAVLMADVQASPARSLMEQLDSDKDGLISLKEAVHHTGLLRNFGLIDDNEDGKLSEAELTNSQLTPGNKKEIASN